VRFRTDLPVLVTRIPEDATGDLSQGYLGNPHADDRSALRQTVRDLDVVWELAINRPRVS